MSALPRIPSPNGPVIVPAVAEQSFPDLFFTQLLFVAVPGCDQIQIRTRPYNWDTGTIKPESEESVTNERGLWQLAADYPLVAQVMGGVIQACTLLLYLRKAQAVLAPLQAAVDAAVSAVNHRTAMAEVTRTELDDATAAQNALPEDAADDDKTAAANLVVITTTNRDNAASELTAAQSAVTAAFVPLDAQAAVVAGLESQLGK